MSIEKNLHSVFLSYVRDKNIPITVFLVNHVKLQGVMAWFDEESLLLSRDGYTQIVYKHAISTVMPVEELNMYDLLELDNHGNK